MSNVMDLCGVTINVVKLFGHKELKSWIEFDTLQDGTVVGRGKYRAITYDRNGQIVEDVTDYTGADIYFS